jgi:hypothetical protein
VSGPLRGEPVPILRIRNLSALPEPSFRVLETRSSHEPSPGVDTRSRGSASSSSLPRNDKAGTMTRARHGLPCFEETPRSASTPHSDGTPSHRSSRRPFFCSARPDCDAPASPQPCDGALGRRRASEDRSGTTRPLLDLDHPGHLFGGAPEHATRSGREARADVRWPIGGG